MICIYVSIIICIFIYIVSKIHYGATQIRPINPVGSCIHNGVTNIVLLHLHYSVVTCRAVVFIKTNQCALSKQSLNDNAINVICEILSFQTKHFANRWYILIQHLMHIFLSNHTLSYTKGFHEICYVCSREHIIIRLNSICFLFRCSATTSIQCENENILWRLLTFNIISWAVIQSDLHINDITSSLLGMKCKFILHLSVPW